MEDDFENISEGELELVSQGIEFINNVIDDNEVLLSETEEIESDRFGKLISDSEIQFAVKDSVPLNTRRRDQWSVNVFRSWAIARNGKRVVTEDKYCKVEKDIEVMDKSELNYWMSKFVCEARKKDGDFYYPKTLVSLVTGIQSYLRINCSSNVQFFVDKEFVEFRNVLDSEMKRLSKSGIGCEIKRSEAITLEEENLLWDLKILGDHNPKVLLNTLVFLNGKNFGLRGGIEHRNLKRSQLSLLKKGNDESLKYVSDVSKNNLGGIKHRRIAKREVVHHAMKNNIERCHVRLYKKYISLCPQTDIEYFYLTPLKCVSDDSSVWYSRVVVGQNSLAAVVKEMCEKGNIGGRKTNHSLRATMVSRLSSAGVDDKIIMDRSGHRSIDGLNSYKRDDVQQQKHTSSILNNDGDPKEVKVENEEPGVKMDSARGFHNCTFTFTNCHVYFGKSENL